MAGWEKIKGGASMPPGDWKRVTPLLDTQGIVHRKDAVLAFAKLAIKLHSDGKPFGLIVESEPDNPVDENALKVIGWGRGASYHVGYVEATESARAAERFPVVPLAAEFYSIYLGSGGWVDIRFFLAAPKDAKPVSSGRLRSLLEFTRDELLVLAYAARADGKLGRLEHDIMQAYAHERAKDFDINLVEEDVADMKRWCKEQDPKGEEVEAAIYRLVDGTGFSPQGLWELIEIVLTIDGKVSKDEKAIAAELGVFIRDASGVTPWA